MASSSEGEQAAAGVMGHGSSEEEKRTQVGREEDTSRKRCADKIETWEMSSVGAEVSRRGDRRRERLGRETDRGARARAMSC